MKLYDGFNLNFDVNGNSILSISKSVLGDRGFSIQIGELGYTCRHDIIEATLEDIKDSVYTFVRDHGTDRQKALICKPVTLLQMYEGESFKYLSDDLIYKLGDLICKGCRYSTKKEFKICLRGALRHSSNAQHYAARTDFNGGSWSYTAGQSYPDDLREFREAVIY